MTTQLNTSWALVTHIWTHMDEYIAIWLLKLFGKSLFPGVSDATVEYVDAGSSLPEEYHKKGNEYPIFKECKIPVGVYGPEVTPFDEHGNATSGASRVRGEAAVSLMAKYLGITNSRLLALVEHATGVDLSGENIKDLTMFKMVKFLNTLYADDPKRVFDWVMIGLDAYAKNESIDPTLKIEDIANALEGATRQTWEQEVDSALKFRDRANDEGKKHIEESAQRFEMYGPILSKDRKNYDKIKVLVVEGNNTDLGRLGVSLGGPKNGASLAIVKKSNGQVQIYTRRSSCLKLSDLAAVLNVMEQTVAGKIAVTDWRDLHAEGRIPNGVWHNFVPMNQILNGSLSAPNMEPTHLSLELIINAVKIALGSTEKRRLFLGCESAPCNGEACTSTRSTPCPWHQYGLRRCQSVRFQSRKNGR